MFCNTLNGRLFVPEKQIQEAKQGYVYLPCNGFGASLAVLENGNCIGWIDTQALGFENVRDWASS